jgi:hypothetical protein
MSTTESPMYGRTLIPSPTPQFKVPRTVSSSLLPQRKRN